MTVELNFIKVMRNSVPIEGSLVVESIDDGFNFRGRISIGGLNDSEIPSPNKFNHMAVNSTYKQPETQGPDAFTESPQPTRRIFYETEMTFSPQHDLKFHTLNNNIFPMKGSRALSSDQLNRAKKPGFIKSFKKSFKIPSPRQLTSPKAKAQPNLEEGFITCSTETLQEQNELLELKTKHEPCELEALPIRGSYFKDYEQNFIETHRKTPSPQKGLQQRIIERVLTFNDTSTKGGYEEQLSRSRQSNENVPRFRVKLSDLDNQPSYINTESSQSRRTKVESQGRYLPAEDQESVVQWSFNDKMTTQGHFSTQKQFESSQQQHFDKNRQNQKSSMHKNRKGADYPQARHTFGKENAQVSSNRSSHCPSCCRMISDMQTTPRRTLGSNTKAKPAQQNTRRNSPADTRRNSNCNASSFDFTVLKRRCCSKGHNIDIYTENPKFTTILRKYKADASTPLQNKKTTGPVTPMSTRKNSRQI